MDDCKRIPKEVPKKPEGKKENPFNDLPDTPRCGACGTKTKWTNDRWTCPKCDKKENK